LKFFRPKTENLQTATFWKLWEWVTDNSAIESIEINGTKAYIDGDKFSGLIKLKEGENEIKVIARDIFGNSSSVSMIVNLDTVPPSFHFDYLRETDRTLIRISGKTEKDAKVFFRDKQLENINGNFSVDVSLAHGKNYFFFKFEDLAGNKAVTTIEIRRIEIIKIILQVGNKNMFVNSQSVPVDPGRDTAPIIKNGRVLVPIRSIVEAIGGKIYWDSGRGCRTC